jgi:hypothetical protein
MTDSPPEGKRRQEMPQSKAALSPTKSLDEALKRFDPLHPLQTEEELESFYVAREESPLDPLISYLTGVGQPVKVLFMGHTGSGKSSELAKLASRLRDQFLVIPFSARQALDINDVEPVDVLLGSALAVLNAAFLHQVDYDLSLWRETDQWVRNEVVQESVNLRRSEKTGWASLKLLIAELSGRWYAESSTRRTLRPRLQCVTSDLAHRVNAAMDHFQEVVRKPALILIEDLDKALLTQARRVFCDESRILHLLDCSVVYTFPIALRYSNDYADISQNFHSDFKLPNIKVNNPDRSPYQPGRDSLRDLVLRRADPSLFGPGALDRAVELSGGLVRHLVRLLQKAVLSAIVARQPAVTTGMVNAIAADMRSDFQAFLRSDHHDALRRSAETHKMVNDPAVQECLHNLSLLEYRNEDNDWCDVHPIVRSLL